MTAARCHIGDTHHRREWSRVTGATFFLCGGHTVSSSSLRLVDDVCRHGIRDRPAEHKRGGGGSKLRDGNSDPFP